MKYYENNFMSTCCGIQISITMVANAAAVIVVVIVRV